MCGVRGSMIVIQCLALLGCGDRLQRVPVSGKVTAQGVPLADATVQFIPESGTNGPGGVGHTDKSGFYVLTGPDRKQGVTPGEYKIRISRIVGPDGKPLALGETEADNPGCRETIPPPYGGPRPTKVVDVPADGATIDIDIRARLLDRPTHTNQ